MKAHHPVCCIRKQRGLVAVIVTIALLAFLGIAALAIDINHALLNRTKLQNGVDAAALSAASILDSAGSEDDAITVAKTTLSQMAVSDGNKELNFSSPTKIDITFSYNPKFTDNYTGVGDPDRERYVRVEVSNLSLDSFFLHLFVDKKTVSASALAGPSASGGSCNLAPMAVCGTDTPANKYGYNTNDVYALKLGSNTSPMGSGNFQLLDLDDINKLPQQLAGEFEECISPEDAVWSKPGNNIGPVEKGLNARFGAVDASVKLPDNYQPDEVTDEAEFNAEFLKLITNNQIDDFEEKLKDILNVKTNGSDNKDLPIFPSINQGFELLAIAKEALKENELLEESNPTSNKILSTSEKQLYQEIESVFSSISSSDLTFNYNKYEERYLNDEELEGFGMRLIAVPIIDCTEDTTGKSQFNVFNIGCFFLLKKAPDSNGEQEDIFGEFFDICPVQTVEQNGVSSSTGVYRIVLYDDPFNKDS